MKKIDYKVREDISVAPEVFGGVQHYSETDGFTVVAKSKLGHLRRGDEATLVKRVGAWWMGCNDYHLFKTKFGFGYLALGDLVKL